MSEQSEKSNCPPVPEALLKFLQERFPDRIPDSRTADLGELRGEQRVIRLLKREFDTQSQTVLEKP